MAQSAMDSSEQPLEAQSDVIETIEIDGNQRIENRTILTYLSLKPGDAFDRRDISDALKDLFNTGFFADVKLLRRGNTLIVRVLENPIVNEVAFEGNERIDTEDLEKEITLNSRSIYTKTKL